MRAETEAAAALLTPLRVQLSHAGFPASPLLQLAHAQAVRCDAQCLIETSTAVLGSALRGVLPDSAAAGRAVRELLMDVQCQMVQTQRASQSTAPPTRMVVSAPLSGPPMLITHTDRSTSIPDSTLGTAGGMLNFGLSGGMNPTGTRLAKQRWLDAGITMQCLGAAFWFAIGCRRPPGVDMATALPSFPYSVEGPASTKYDAVALMLLPELVGTVVWLPQRSRSTRTCWADLGHAEFWVGVYIPPLPGATEPERAAIVNTLFEEWDEQVRYCRHLKTSGTVAPRIKGCGDLNPSPPLLSLFRRHLHRRHLRWASCTRSPTHLAGGVLDFIWEDAGDQQCGPVLHDGQACRLRGCTHPGCGRLPEYTGSKDLDHHPWTFTALCARGSDPGMQLLRSRFVGDVAAWTHAFGASATLLGALAQDAADARSRPQIWVDTDMAQRRIAVDALEWIWTAVSTLTAWSAGLTITRSALPQDPTNANPHAGSRTAASVSVEFLAARPPARLQQSERLHRTEIRAVIRRDNNLVVRRYLTLLREDSKKAERFLGSILRQPTLGLPHHMVDSDGHLLTGGAVLQGAADYVVAWSCPPSDACLATRAARTAELCTTRIEVAAELAAQVRAGQAVVTMETLEEAMRGIRKSACCKGVPYAALCADLPESKQFHLHHQGLALDLGLCARAWVQQDVYHAAKPGRNRTGYEAYRILGLNAPGGRLQEELWLQLVGVDLWEHVGLAQDAGKDALVVSLADMESAALRAAQDLPFGIVWADRKEAFDTAWRVEILLRLRDQCGIRGRFFSVADQLLSRTSMSITTPFGRSQGVSPGVGTVQGRKLSPANFCIGQAVLEEALSRSVVPVGLNPPQCAVAAYIAARDGSMDAPYDLEKAEDLWGLIQAGCLAWAEAMVVAGTDTTRLLLLDIASTITRGARSYVDDTRAPVSSHGHAEAVVRTLADVASKQQYSYKASKMAVTAADFKRTAPIPLQGAGVEYKDHYVALGIADPIRPMGAGHLALIAGRAPYMFLSHMASLREAGLPLSAVLKSIQVRLIPAVFHGLELVMHHTAAPKILNSIQATWLKALLGLDSSVPRIILMRELGIQERLSSIGWCRALALRSRILADPKFASERSIVHLAEAEPDTWSAATADLASVIALPPLQHLHDGTSAARKQRQRTFTRQVIAPAVQRWEHRSWRSQPKHDRYLAEHPATRWYPTNLQDEDLDQADLCAWAQLKLQGHWSPEEQVGPGPRPVCGLCKSDTPETRTHLFHACRAARAAFSSLLDGIVVNETELMQEALGGAATLARQQAWVRLMGRLGRRAARAASRREMGA